jgi:wyosine [tRNA(Phe)-imidazoG37] synthetase (radical SAM superfamily)
MMAVAMMEGDKPVRCADSAVHDVSYRNTGKGFLSTSRQKTCQYCIFFHFGALCQRTMIAHAISSHDRGEDHSGLVYPVISRRSGGLSVGINLFPDAKRCSFDCPYCEVSPFDGKDTFSTQKLEAALELFFTQEYSAAWANLPVRDLCVSGNGEPTLSPFLEDALELCASARRKYADIAGTADIVVITNSTGFLRDDVAGMLRRFGGHEAMKIWAKLDAGTQDRFALMSRSPFALADIVRAIGEFARGTAVVIQTMLCDLNGKKPDSAEAAAYAHCLDAMIDRGARIDAVHFYTVARPPLETWADPLSDDEIRVFMERVAEELGDSLPLSGYGASGVEPVYLR